MGLCWSIAPLPATWVLARGCKIHAGDSAASAGTRSAPSAGVAAASVRLDRCARRWPPPSQGLAQAAIEHAASRTPARLSCSCTASTALHAHSRPTADSRRVRGLRGSAVVAHGLASENDSRAQSAGPPRCQALMSAALIWASRPSG